MVLEKHNFRRFATIKTNIVDFDEEVQIIKSTFKSVGYPLPFTDNTILTFEEKNIGGQNKETQ